MTIGKARDDGANIDVALVRRPVSGQFPRWADLPIRRVEAGGVDNRTFHLGERMTVRLPSDERYAPQVEKEHRWLPGLAPLLPLPIPVPLAKGEPAGGYPWQWSVYRWIDGETAAIGRIEDLVEFGAALADFLVALYGIDPAGGPRPGPHNFFSRRAADGLRRRDVAGARRPRRRDRHRRGGRGVGGGARGEVAGAARLVPRGRRLGEPPGQE